MGGIVTRQRGLLGVILLLCITALEAKQADPSRSYGQGANANLHSSYSPHQYISGGASARTSSDDTLKAIKEDSSSILLPPTSQEIDVDHPYDNLVAKSSSSTNVDNVLFVRKRDGRLEQFNSTKLQNRLLRLVSMPSGSDTDQATSSSSSAQLDLRYLNISSLTETVHRGLYDNVTTYEIDTLMAESAASRATQHPDYGRLAARILITQCHKTTPPTFSQAVHVLSRPERQELLHPGAVSSSFLDARLADLVHRRQAEIDAQIRHERDLDFTYFGFKTLERAYLLRQDSGALIERPQYLMMRVALGIHCLPPNGQLCEDEDTCLQAAFETYDLMSRGYFTHASPTLFHSGTTHPQLSSCFLVQMSDDSIQGIYQTLQRCAVISKAAGGIGLSVHNIRARGTPIRGTRGVSNGLVPMLRVYDVTSRYVDQGGGKRPGAFAIYLEPWHADIFEVLNLKKNHGKEEQRARDLFYGLWIPDLFMKRVQEDGMWSLMCPHLAPGLQERHGQAFEELYEQYEREGRSTRQVRARELWSAILESQIETGTPYMLYKDACNRKSNQQNLGTIQCSNLCTEIIQYTDKDEVAVCNLASLCLPKFVVSDRGPFGSVSISERGSAGPRAYFDHEALHRATKIVTKNLNKVIDINSYPVEGSKLSNYRHRPIGIGVAGLADTFVRLGLPFASPEAKQLNEAIFETIYNAALEASAELAEKEGAYESFVGSPASKGLLQFHLWGVNEENTPSNSYCMGRVDAAVAQRYADDSSQKGYDWGGLRRRIMKSGLRNSLLLAPMPTASTSQILGVNECFEPFSSNLYIRRVKAGEFIMTNPHLLQDLTDRGLWTPAIRNQLMRDSGSVQNIAEIPDRLKELYRTVWEIKMKDIIDMAADRGKFIDQSQSLNLFLADPTVDKITAMHFYAWKKGLKTGMYYLRTKPAVNAIQYTVDKTTSTSIAGQRSLLDEVDDRDDVCLSCQG